MTELIIKGMQRQLFQLLTYLLSAKSDLLLEFAEYDVDLLSIVRQFLFLLS